MRSCGVVIDAPLLDDSPSLGQRPEDIVVEAFISESTVEAFDECVLRWLTGIDLVQLYTTMLCEIKHRVTGQLGSIFHYKCRWKRAAFVCNAM
jgi:hypothetical protein